MHRTSLVLAALVVAMSSAVAAPFAGAAQPPTGRSFRPTVELDQGQLVLRWQRGGRPYYSLVQWKGTDRVRSIDPYRPRHGEIVNVQDWNAGTTTFGTGSVRALADGYTIRTAFSIAPDGQPDLETLLLDYSLPLITRQRSGVATFSRVRSGGRMVLRARMAEPAVECAGARAGTRTVELDPATFLPRRVLVVRGGRLDTQITAARMRRSAGSMPALRFRGRHRGRAERFIARTPEQAAAIDLPFTVAMPTVVPDGFELATTGSAPKGATFGPEGSFPTSNGVFAAQWRRGLETLELTIRSGSSALTTAWDEFEPFGYECGTSRRSQATVSGHAATYALGAYGGGRLWWRDGATMYTLTAPLPRVDLVRVAESLAPVATVS